MKGDSVGLRRAILAAVVLLFHQQVQLIKAVQYCSILFLIITERLPETNEGKAAFVFYFVAHEELREPQIYNLSMKASSRMLQFCSDMFGNPQKFFHKSINVILKGAIDQLSARIKLLIHMRRYQHVWRGDAE